MEQQIIKYEKRMPDHVRAMLDRSKKHKGQCSRSCGWCGGGPGLDREEKWRALICATYYEDHVSVRNLLEDDALDKNVLKWTRNDQLNICSCVDAFPRLYVLPLTVAIFTQNQDIIALLKDKSDLEDEMCSLDALAVYMGDIDLLDQCIKNNLFDALYNDKAGGGLLQFAVRNGDEKMVERLLQIPDVKKYINSGRFDCAPVLFIAAQRGLCNIAEKLCVAGANPANVYIHSYNGIKALPIHTAAEHKHTAMVEFLCQQASDLINEPNVSGNTALHIAVHGGDEKTVTVLLAVPTIKVDIENNYGETPLMIAQKNWHHRCECLLWRWMDKNRSTQ
jgi:ankyrin repeat protein